MSYGNSDYRRQGDYRSRGDYRSDYRGSNGVSSQTAMLLIGIGCLLVLYAIAAYDYFYG